MPILNQASNIPGLMVEFKDGGLALRKDIEQSSTRSVLILGTSLDGPIMTPVAVDVDSAEAVFGKGVKANGRPNGATLPEAFNQLYKEGCRDIRMMRISGSIAKKTLFCEQISNTTEEIMTETLGIVSGNDEMSFTLNRSNIIPGSVEVYAAGSKLLSSSFTVAPGLNSSIVTLLAEKVSVGSDIVIKFKVCTADPIAFDGSITSLYNNVNNTVDLIGKPISGVSGIPELSILKSTDGVLWEPALFSIVEDLVTFDPAIDTATTSIKAIFSYYPDSNCASPIISQNSNSVGSDVWVAIAEDPQEFILSEIPLSGEFKLYVDDKEIFNTDSYEVNELTKSLFINKEFFSLNSKVEFNYIFEAGEVVTPMLQLETVFGGSLYNDAKVEVENVITNGSITDKLIVLTKPALKKSSSSEKSLIYKASDFVTLKELVDEINTDSRNNVFIAEVHEDFENADSMLLDQLVESNFEDGTDGISVSKQDLFEKLSGLRDASGVILEEGAYSVLQNYIVDFIVPLGVYADDKLMGKYDNFASELSYFCGLMTGIHMHVTHGVIEVKPPKKNDMISIENHVKQLEEYNNVYLMRDFDGTIETNSDGLPLDMGQYISVLAGPEGQMSSNRLGVYSGSLVCKYVALLSVLATASAPTNKQLESVLGLKWNFSIPQLNRLAVKRFVSFKQRPTDNAIVPTDGVTAALEFSDYRRVVHVNVIREILKEVRNASEPFIGEAITVPLSNALTSAIDKKLKIKSDPTTGIISGYEFRILYDESNVLLGDTRIELTIVPFGERRSITVVVGLKPAL